MDRTITLGQALSHVRREAMTYPLIGLDVTTSGQTPTGQVVVTPSFPAYDANRPYQWIDASCGRKWEATGYEAYLLQNRKAIEGVNPRLIEDHATKNVRFRQVLNYVRALDRAPYLNPSCVIENHPSYDSCLTRFDLRERGYPDSYMHDARVDDFGCMINSTTGRRYNPLCYKGRQHTIRPGDADYCSSVPTYVNLDDGGWASVLRSIISAVKFVSAVVPYVGPVIGPAIGHVIDKVSESLKSVVSAVSDTITTVIRTVKQVVSTVIEYAKNVLNDAVAYIGQAVLKTFSTLSSSVKSFIDIIPGVGLLTNGFDIGKLTSYLSVREGLTIVQSTLTNKFPVIGTMNDLVKTGMTVDSLDDVMAFKDVQKNYIAMQSAIESYRSYRQIPGAAIDPMQLQSYLLGNFSLIESKTADQLARFTDGGMAIAADVADKLTGAGRSPWDARGKALLDLFDPTSIGDLIPDVSLRGDFIANAREAVAFTKSLDPQIEIIWKTYQSSLDVFQSVFRGPPSYARDDQAGYERSQQWRDHFPEWSAMYDDLKQARLRRGGGASVRDNVAWQSHEYFLRLRTMYLDAKNRADEETRRVIAGRKRISPVFFTPANTRVLSNVMKSGDPKSAFRLTRASTGMTAAMKLPYNGRDTRGLPIIEIGVR